MILRLQKKCSFYSLNQLTIFKPFPHPLKVLKSKPWLLLGGGCTVTPGHRTGKTQRTKAQKEFVLGGEANSLYLKGEFQDCSGTIAYKATASGECVSTEIRVVVRANKLKKTEIQYKDVSTG